MAEENARLLPSAGAADRVGLAQAVQDWRRQRDELQRKVDAFSAAAAGGAEAVLSGAEELRLKHNEFVGKFGPPANRAHADMRADNLFVLEKHFRELVGGDAEKMAAIREYVGFDEDMDTIEKGM